MSERSTWARFLIWVRGRSAFQVMVMDGLFYLELSQNPARQGWLKKIRHRCVLVQTYKDRGRPASKGVMCSRHVPISRRRDRRRKLFLEHCPKASLIPGQKSDAPSPFLVPGTKKSVKHGECLARCVATAMNETDDSVPFRVSFKTEEPD